MDRKKLSLAMGLGAALLLGGLSCNAQHPAHAPAGHMHDRFNAMDTNGDGKLVLEEFRAAFPNMNEKAFEVIDINGDKGIDQAEWFQFTEGHASGKMPGNMEQGAPMNNMPGDPLIPPPDSSDLPLMRPPGMN